MLWSMQKYAKVVKGSLETVGIQITATRAEGKPRVSALDIRCIAGRVPQYFACSSPFDFYGMLPGWQLSCVGCQRTAANSQGLGRLLQPFITAFNRQRASESQRPSICGCFIHFHSMYANVITCHYYKIQQVLDSDWHLTLAYFGHVQCQMALPVGHVDCSKPGSCCEDVSWDAWDARGGAGHALGIDASFHVKAIVVRS